MNNQIDVRKMNNTEFKEFTKGRFFTATFTKKDGSLREYKGARVEVTKDSQYTMHNNVEHKQNLVSVYVPNEKRPRATLNLSTVKKFAFQGQVWEY